LDVASLEQQVGAYFAGQLVEGETINVDGKTLRGSIPEGETRGVHLLSGYAVQQGVVLKQVAVEEKSNEITAAPQLLADLDLSGKVVTGDAMLTQREICTQIVEAGGDYVFPVKGNQAALRQAIAESFLPMPDSHGYPQPPLPTHCATTLNKQRGRIEYRWLDCHAHLNEYLDWTGLQQVFRLQRVVHHLRTGKLTYEVGFGITSLQPQQASPQALLDHIRQHWHVENRLHYVRDVTFHEDACPIRQPQRQHVLATLNNLAIGLIRQCEFDFIPQAHRYFSVHFAEAFQLLC
jgi:predicted transposase YbfD/YdcC